MITSYSLKQDHSHPVKKAFGCEPLQYRDKAILEYLDAIKTMRKKTQRSMRQRLSLFPAFVRSTYNMTVDHLIEDVKSGKLDRYVALSKYATYVKSQGKSDDRIHKLVKAARILFEFHNIEISDRQFRIRVKLPRIIRRAKKATDKQEITEFLQGCHDPELELAILWHAATGRRPEEVFSIRHTDLDFKKKTFLVRGEYTKMGVEQVRPMPNELAVKTERFIQWKHRPRWVYDIEEGTGRRIPKKIYPKVRPYDLLFAQYRRNETRVDVSPEMLYVEYSEKLRNYIDSLGKGERISESPMAPRKFTFYRLRDHVKTTISDLGYGDFGEWLIGHQHSTYYNQPEKKRAEVFAKVEPYLTYLDVTALEAKGADVAARLEERDRQIQGLIKKQEQLETLIQSLIDSGHIKPS